jgi:hypothetical protein
MKKILQYLDYEFHPGDLIGWKKWADKLIPIRNAEEGDPEIPLIMGTNLANRDHKNWIIYKRPYIASNRQLTRNWCDKHRTMARISVNSYAATKLGNFPHTRWPTQQLEKNPWKVKEIKNVLIAPPEKSIYVWTGMWGLDWAEKIKNQLESQGANVKIRPKLRKRGPRSVTLFDDLDWADLVVTYSSAISVEAFWWGKKVISLGVCPTWVACDNTLANWQDPIEPINRDVWHEHISWIQFTYEEFLSGHAQEMTYQYQGWPTEVSVPDNEIVVRD